MDKIFYFCVKNNYYDYDNFFLNDSKLECFCKPIEIINYINYKSIKLQIIKLIKKGKECNSKENDIIIIYDFNYNINNKFMSENPKCNIFSKENYLTKFLDIEIYNTLMTNSKKLYLINENNQIRKQIKEFSDQLEKNILEINRLDDNENLYL